MKILRELTLCCLLFPALAAYGAIEHYTVYLETDNIGVGQCTENGVSGIDYRLVLAVDNNSKTLQQVDLSQCNINAFNTPTTLNLADWVLGAGNGGSGSDLIEGRLPLAPLGYPTQINIAVVSDLTGTAADTTGATWRGITLNLPGTHAVPVLNTPLFALLVALMFTLAWRGTRRRYAVSGWLLMLCLTPFVAGIAWATTIAIDGIDDWALADRQYYLAPGDRINGDLRAVYLTNDNGYAYIRVDAHVGPLLPVIPQPMNDTGIVRADNYPSGRNTDCTTGTVIAAQDCSHGRDAQALAGTLVKVGAGVAGFDFTKLDNNGDDLPASATSWQCVRDNVTGLVWEVKTDDGGLHDKDNQYAWYNSDANNNGGFPGDYNSGINTQNFVAAVNAASWCGASDWRLPSADEFHSISDYSRVSPAIDTAYFPHTVAYFHWSLPYAANGNLAWGFNFTSGYINLSNKSSDYHVRLVRGGL